MPATNINIYAGMDNAGVLRKRAMQREAARKGKRVSVSDLFWRAVKENASPALRADLDRAEEMERLGQ